MLLIDALSVLSVPFFFTLSYIFFSSKRAPHEQVVNNHHYYYYGGAPAQPLAEKYWPNHPEEPPTRKKKGSLRMAERPPTPSESESSESEADEPITYKQLQNPAPQQPPRTHKKAPLKFRFV